MTKSDKIRMILRQLNGEATDDEKELFSQWLLKDPENLDLYIEIKTMWETSVSRETTFNIDKASFKLHEAIASEKHHIDWWKHSRHIAAAVIVLLVVGTAIFNQLNRFSIAKTHQDTVKLITKSSGVGEQLRVKLPDESIVLLNAESFIQFPEKFDDSLRQVILHGEAFFEVTKDSLHPFQVHSNRFSTTVLGTSFNVKTFDTEKITVTVATGKVKVEKKNEGKNDEIFLLPNQQATYNSTEKKLKKAEVNASDYLAWTQGTIRFNNDPLEEVISTLERWYGVDIQLGENASSSIRINGSYTDKKLYSILDGLTFIYDLEYTFKNDSILVINPKPKKIKLPMIKR